MAALSIDGTPVCVNLTFTKEDSFPFSFTFQDSTGTPLDFTGSLDVSLTVNTSPDGSGTTEFTLAPTNTLDATGVLIFQPTVLEMDIGPSTFFYDLQWTNAGGDVRTLANGLFIVLQQITGGP